MMEKRYFFLTALLLISISFVSAQTQTFTVNGVSFKMVFVRGGTFTMGATSEQGSDADDDEKPAHRVLLSDYYIGQTEVTQALWQAVMGSNPSNWKGNNLPVECVSFNDCELFITKLNQLTGHRFRLPTDAEWEYAARGGAKSRGYKYAGSNNIGTVAWYDGNSGSKTHPVGQKQANELGVYDMSGNVLEWCQDRYDKNYYSKSPSTNPCNNTSPYGGRVIRGGCWDFGPRNCRVSNHSGCVAYYSLNDLGLRIALTSSPATSTTLSSSSSSSSEERKIYEYDDVDVKPSFPGGKDAMLSWIRQNIYYPTVAKEKGIQGWVGVAFVVEKDGSITNVQVVRSPDDLFNTEAVRLVKSMPKWTPARLKGKIVRAKSYVTVTFELFKSPISKRTTSPSPPSSSAQNLSITVNGVSFTMVAVQGGTFSMGATSEQGSNAESDEKPAHRVTLSDYYIGQTEVTQALWKAVMGNNPSHFKGNNLPVEWVSWNECQQFITKLNQLTGRKFRLPTEAEWEYAARGGNKSQGYKNAGGNDLGSVAWSHGNSGRQTHPVGQKQANELGLYDMSGNVWEWCQDWYDYDYYGKSPSTNPCNNTSASGRVNRGGSWRSAGYCRVSNRNGNGPDYSDGYLGLRLAL